MFSLTLCRAQRPKTSARVRGQNVPKRPVAIGKLRCFQTRKFPYNLARISWIITVRDFRYFLPRHLHCLCVRSESERVFKVESKKRVAGFRDGSLRRYQTTTNDSMARAEDSCVSRGWSTLGLRRNEVSSVHTSDWSRWEQWWSGRRYRDRNGWSRRTRPIDDRFTVINRRKNLNKHRFGRSRC